MKATILDRRGVVRISGADASDWLQGLITNDITKADDNNACFAALLTPQGKILFDFLILRQEGDYFLDCDADVAATLAKRLTLYRLRAKISIEDCSSTFTVTAVWDSDDVPSHNAKRDPRHPGLGWRIIHPRDTDQDGIQINASVGEYDARRVALGIPEGGVDFGWSDLFPHDANMDELDGVDFKKGCYVGQEVVSRVQHRGSARKRFRKIIRHGAGSPGDEITAGEMSIGTLTSLTGDNGLALVRIDRLEDAASKGLKVQSGATKIDILDV